MAAGGSGEGNLAAFVAKPYVESRLAFVLASLVAVNFVCDLGAVLHPPPRPINASAIRLEACGGGYFFLDGGDRLRREIGNW